MSKFTKEQKQQIEAQFGTIKQDHEYGEHGVTIPEVVEFFGHLNYHRDNKHLGFFWQRYTPKGFDENKPLENFVDKTNINGVEYDAFNFHSMELIQSVLSHLADVKDWDITQKTIEYLEKTGQSEALAEYKKEKGIEEKEDDTGTVEVKVKA